MNKSLQELAVATLGHEGEARHAEALRVSCVAHLARTLPELRVMLRQRPNAPEPEVIRLRRENLERRETEVEVREARILSFAEDSSEVVNAIETGAIFPTRNEKWGGKDGFKLSDSGRQHFLRHRMTYELLLQNPNFPRDMRLMLKMTLGELDLDPGEAANDGAQPGTDEEAS